MFYLVKKERGMRVLFSENNEVQLEMAILVITCYNTDFRKIQLAVTATTAFSSMIFPLITKIFCSKHAQNSASRNRKSWLGVCVPK